MPFKCRKICYNDIRNVTERVGAVMIHKDFPERLASLRRRAKMSQSQLGEYLGLTNRAVSKWENGICAPSAKNLISLSKIFNIPLEYFYAEVTPPQVKSNMSGMESLRELFRTGRGPSSSHTIGPEAACLRFRAENPDATKFKVILYGSLAKTGKGHGTEAVIRKTFAPIPCDVELNFAECDLSHPNTMDLFAEKNGVLISRARVLSVGGGKIVFDGETGVVPLIYPHTTFSDIADICTKRNLRLWEYALQYEDSSFFEYMRTAWTAMKKSIQAGLCDEGILPGGLGVAKKAKQLYCREHVDESAVTRENRLVCAYAFAVSERNAAGETIVTAPTCGAAGVVPAVLYYQQQKNGYSDDDIVRALISGGIIGNLVKTNASISGAECGCQAEIGTACAMAAASLGELFSLNLDKIEYAAEISIEHHLGLTCDPICGLVQIPCIERNAVAAMRAINSVNIASFLSDTRKISLDNVIHVMRETGNDLSNRYKETSEAGLAKLTI